VEFKKLIAWLDEQLSSGLKVHVGCVGGHGRTGTVLSALVAARIARGVEIAVDGDVIGYVRTNYCKKAVETAAQVEFLVQHYGVKSVSGSYVDRVSFKGHKGYKDYYDYGDYGKSNKTGWFTGDSSSASSKNINSGSAIRNDGTIWTKNVIAVG
jgi:hypothetical protein